MADIVVFSIAAHGHVNPVLPIVEELIRRGESVVFYNAPEFRAQVERTGATFRPYPATDLTGATISQLVQTGSLAHVTALLLRANERLLPFALDELRRAPPDLVIFDALALWGRMAATTQGLRSAATLPYFVIDEAEALRKAPRAVLRQLRWLPLVPGLLAAQRDLKRRFGAAYPPSPPLFPMRGDLNLVFSSRELYPASALIDASFRFVGPSINPRMRDGDAQPDAPGQRRLVYISLGTLHSAQTAFYRRCFDELGDYPAQFVLSAGRHTDSSALGAIPPNFVVRPAVAQLAMLERADAFVSHGGMNSVHESLYYGVPLVLVPQQLEQLFGALAVQAHGAGVLLDGQVTRNKIQAGALRRGVDAVLSQPRYRAAAQALQLSLRATGGYRQAADEIQVQLAAVAG